MDDGAIMLNSQASQFYISIGKFAMNATYSRAFEALIASEITAGNDGQVRLYEHDGRVLAYLDFAEPELADAAAQALLGADLRVVPRWAYDEDEMEVTASTALLGGTCELVSP